MQATWKSTWCRRGKAKREKVQTRVKAKVSLATMAKVKFRKVRILEKASTVQRDSTKGNGGNNSQQQKKLDVNTCAYCGKSRHGQKDYLKKEADQNQVRVVGEVQDTAHLTSAASVSTGLGSQAVRILTGHPVSCQVSHFEDLTIHSNPTSPCSVHVLHVLSECACHDMTATDDDGRWTLSP